MEVDFTETQMQLRESAARFFADRFSSSRVRASLANDPVGLDRSDWAAVAEMGFLGVAIPEEEGGLGLSEIELCLVAEQCGRSLARLPFASTLYAASEAILRGGSAEQRQHWLPAIAGGTQIAAFVDVAASGGTAAFTIDGDMLSGSAGVVADGMIADLLVIACGDGVWLLETNSPGVSRRPVETIDPLRPHARIDIDAARAGRLPNPVALAALRNRAAILTAFEQIGGADVALEGAVAYAKERRAFSRPIGSFQAVKHMLADMYVSAVLARSNAYYAVWALARDVAKLPKAAAAARLSATTAYRRCAANAIQVHGGIGFTWDLDCHFHYRRSNTLALTLGGIRPWEDQLLQSIHEERALHFERPS